LGVLTPPENMYDGSQYVLTPKYHNLSFKIVVVGQLCKFHIIKDESLVPKMEVNTNFSRHLKHFDGLIWLTPTPHILRHTYATDCI